MSCNTIKPRNNLGVGINLLTVPPSFMKVEYLECHAVAKCKVGWARRDLARRNSEFDDEIVKTMTKGPR
jgi:phage pi2 protein 07